MEETKIQNIKSQDEEIEVLIAIYEKEFAVEDAINKVYSIKIHSETNKNVFIELHIRLTEAYPSDAPPIFEISAPFLKANGKAQIQEALRKVYFENQGQTIIFQCIEKVREKLQSLHSKAERHSKQKHEEPNSKTKKRQKVAEVICPTIIHGEVLLDRKSSFQGHAAAVFSIEEVRLVLDHLKDNRKIEHATHNIYAYRIYNEKSKCFEHDCDDDGEHGAASKLMHLLEIMNIKNALVVVSRWHGGISLGPDRFKHINNAARNSLSVANMIPSN